MLFTTLTLTLAQAAQQQPTQPADDTNFVVWGIVLIAIAVALFMVEIFVPSGGIIGIASATALIGGIICLFLDSAALGLVGATVALFALPFAVGFAIKLWPNTPIGRALTLQPPQWQQRAANDDEDEDDPDAARPAVDRPTARSVNGLTAGMRGRAMSHLRPVGTCLFDGKREECLAIGSTIDAGTPVRIVSIDGMHVKVKAADN
ncbi:MAG: hypothetical protein WD534_13610 [Phycisphaeraceae bacterium]